jgi:hypothetical protein
MEMARKPRLEFAGAIYHVLSRGNYRKELFDDGSARLFEKTLLEASAKCGSWTAERLAMGHPTRVCNLIRATCKYRTDRYLENDLNCLAPLVHPGKSRSSLAP